MHVYVGDPVFLTVYADIHICITCIMIYGCTYTWVHWYVYVHISMCLCLSTYMYIHTQRMFTFIVCTRKVCSDLLKGGVCPSGSACRYAHSLQELRRSKVPRRPAAGPPATPGKRRAEQQSDGPQPARALFTTPPPVGSARVCVSNAGRFGADLTRPGCGGNMCGREIQTRSFHYPCDSSSSTSSFSSSPFDAPRHTRFLMRRRRIC